MNQQTIRTSFNRRDFLKLAGAAVLTATGASVLPQFLRKNLFADDVVLAADPAPNLHFAGTDGWMFLPPTPAIPPYFPDDIATAPFNVYIFGFRNITGFTDEMKIAQKEKAQHVAPLFWVDQYNGSNEFHLQVTNLGLNIRPDLVDEHTLHWHGFRNVIPYFDGEPTGSVSIPIGRDFTYVYRPRDPGTYMYHCHVEDVEHVHQGMNGLVFVRPMQNGNTSLYPSGKFAYNDGDGSTGYDREFAMHLSEVWAQSHWNGSHIQENDWSDYKADFALLNGRAYPYTLAPNGSVDPFNPVADANGDLIAPAGYPELQYQPLSALVTCNAGERVLLRFANLGFRESSMTLAGIKMRVVGRDATLMRGRDGTDTSYLTDTVMLGAGESFDCIFTAPAHSGGAGPDKYVLYNRNYNRTNNLANGYAGQRTEVLVYPSGTVAAQAHPNDWGLA